MIHCRFFMCTLLIATLHLACISRIRSFWGRGAGAPGQSPPGEVQLPHPAHTEFVICDCTIEDFHRGVKTGCRLEQRRLREQGSLENLLAIVSPIAVRLLQLRNLSREEPEQPALVWVEREEAQVIAFQQGVAVEQLTIKQFVYRVAQLGGFLHRSSDGPPGWQTLWNGWLRLRWFVAGMRFAAHAPPNTFARSPCSFW